MHALEVFMLVCRVIRSQVFHTSPHFLEYFLLMTLRIFTVTNTRKKKSNIENLNA